VGTSQSFVCAQCETGMERLHDVPVLRSLVGHAVHRCGQCGHILLVPEDDARDWSVGWLGQVLTVGSVAISCMALL
jgi:hypothetical protein